MNMATGTVSKYADGIDSGWKEITGTAENSYPFKGTVYYRKIGNTVWLASGWLLLKSSVAMKTTLSLFTLDTDYKPINAIVCNSYINNTGDINIRIVPALLNSSGEMVLYANNNEDIPAAYMRVSASYLTD